MAVRFGQHSVTFSPDDIAKLTLKTAEELWSVEHSACAQKHEWPKAAIINEEEKMKIQSKLIWVLLSLSLPLLVVTNIIFYSSEKRALSHNILNHLESRSFHPKTSDT